MNIALPLLISISATEAGDFHLKPLLKGEFDCPILGLAAIDGMGGRLHAVTSRAVRGGNPRRIDGVLIAERDRNKRSRVTTLVRRIRRKLRASGAVVVLRRYIFWSAPPCCHVSRACPLPFPPFKGFT